MHQEQVFLRHLWQVSVLQKDLLSLPASQSDLRKLLLWRLGWQVYLHLFPLVQPCFGYSAVQLVLP
ncbi:hypothetical protein [Galactobacillus timonensis]|uniref:hypothetical protein n=1 Tax=Galactobacillus timonensis TaxID=2041840 RepID=UPI002409207A|nr:hypothetical protein [Galactobacillus timonensis]